MSRPPAPPRLPDCAGIGTLVALATFAWLVAAPTVARSSPDGSWQNFTPAPPRTAGAGIYDPVRERMVFFGGNDTAGYQSGDVAMLSLAPGETGWKVDYLGGPVERWGHSAIYDPDGDRMVIFAGYSLDPYPGGQSHFYNDVWALSLSGSSAWTHLMPTGTPPNIRREHSAIYDPVRKRMIVFGGYSFSSTYGDVWALSLVGTPAWTQLTPAGTPPSPRYAHSAIYDPVRDRMLVFGGNDGAMQSDMRELSLSGTPTWTQLTPSGSPPPARDRHTAVYDPGLDRMIVTCGFDGTRYFNDSWSLSLTGTPQWNALAPLGPLPQGRASHVAIVDPVRH